MDKLFRGTNRDYGNYNCSCCGRPLNVRQKPLGVVYMVVGKEDDDEGREWRGFCSECEQKVSSLPNEKIMDKYEPCSVIQ